MTLSFRQYYDYLLIGVLHTLHSAHIVKMEAKIR